MVELKITAQRDNILLHRKEIEYEMIFKGEATPSRTKIKELISKNLGSNPELVIVDRNIQHAGASKVKGYSKIYKDKESAMLYEPDYELFRNGLKAKEEGAK
ncbi:MAG TPA: 30S ribosomal protein S24e [Thermoplasmataceae archaeon]|nr:30S ribosomal protein S24e [Thermoplasmatales archaeon AK]HLH86106.1 30S ribosomal protein S24e [Thermoplasmataceae archaeon]